MGALPSWLVSVCLLLGLVCGFLPLHCVAQGGAPQVVIRVPLEEGKPPSGPRQLPGEWQLTPLLRKGAEVSDMPQARLSNFGRAYWLDTGVAVFWASVTLQGKAEPERGLFSLKDGQVRTVLLEGENKIPPHVPSGVSAEELNLHEWSAEIRFGLGGRDRRGATPIHAVKSLLYLSVEFGRLARHCGVYGWDGEHLRRVLGRGDELGIRGTRYRISHAQVFGVSPDRKVLMYFKTDEPRDTNGWAWHDGHELTPFLMAGDPLPGLPGVRIQNLAVRRFSSAAVFLSRGRSDVPDVGCTVTGDCSPEIKPAIFGDVILAVLEVSGAPYKKALFRLGNDNAEVILAQDQADPMEPNEKIGGLIDFAASEPETLVVHVFRRKRLGREPILLHYRRGQFLRLFSNSSVPSPWESFQLSQLGVLSVDPPHLIFTVTLNKTHDQWEWGVRWIIASWLTHLHAFDGEQVRVLTHGIPLRPWSQFRFLSEPFPGAVLYAHDTDELAPEVIHSTWYLGAAEGPMRLEEVPFFAAGQEHVPLTAVAGWKNPDEAVVSLSEGVYLLTRKEQPAPAPQ